MVTHAEPKALCHLYLTFHKDDSALGGTKVRIILFTHSKPKKEQHGITTTSDLQRAVQVLAPSTSDFVECTTSKNIKLVAIQLYVTFPICLFLWQLFCSSGASGVTTRLLFLTVMKSFWSTESKSKEEENTA